jgi:hypothetical protein
MHSPQVSSGAAAAGGCTACRGLAGAATFVRLDQMNEEAAEFCAGLEQL